MLTAPKIMQQPVGSSTCGQTCVAMIAKVSLETACRAVGRKSGTHGTHLIKGLKTLGVDCYPTSKLVRKDKPLPECGIMRIQATYDTSWRGHWVLKWGGRIYEPTDGKVWGIQTYVEYLQSVRQRFTSFIEINRYKD
jgi:hypothetical protein